MKKLIFDNETFQAETIVKSDLNIIGYDITNNEVFSFKGISDFSGFILQDENGNVIGFEVQPKTEVELFKEEQFQVNIETILSSAQNTVETMELIFALNELNKLEQAQSSAELIELIVALTGGI